jgi:hypothetical protein
MSKARRLCLFCANPADSKEHIWARWMGPHLPKSDVLKHEVYSETIFPDGPKVKVRNRSAGRFKDF